MPNVQVKVGDIVWVGLDGTRGEVIKVNPDEGTLSVERINGEGVRVGWCITTNIAHCRPCDQRVIH